MGNTDVMTAIAIKNKQREIGRSVFEVYLVKVIYTVLIDKNKILCYTQVRIAGSSDESPSYSGKLATRFGEISKACYDVAGWKGL